MVTVVAPPCPQNHAKGGQVHVNFALLFLALAPAPVGGLYGIRGGTRCWPMGRPLCRSLCRPRCGFGHEANRNDASASSIPGSDSSFRTDLGAVDIVVVVSPVHHQEGSSKAYNRTGNYGNENKNPSGGLGGRWVCVAQDCIFGGGQHKEREREGFENTRKIICGYCIFPCEGGGRKMRARTGRFSAGEFFLLTNQV